MQFIKSRSDIKAAAKQRLGECCAIMEQAVGGLDKVMEAYGIKTPEEIIDRLVDVAENEGGTLRKDADLERLVTTLTRYIRAKDAKRDFEFVIEHVATLGEHADQEGRWEQVPVEWHYQILDQDEVGFYFTPYEGITDSPINYEMGKVAARNRAGIHRLQHLMQAREVGLSTALGKGRF